MPNWARTLSEAVEHINFSTAIPRSLGHVISRAERNLNSNDNEDKATESDNHEDLVQLFEEKIDTTLYDHEIGARESQFYDDGESGTIMLMDTDGDARVDVIGADFNRNKKFEIIAVDNNNDGVTDGYSVDTNSDGEPYSYYDADGMAHLID